MRFAITIVLFASLISICLKLDQAKRMKELGRENTKLKRLVAELSL